eukprot:SAG11_NODE_286_length_11220_cov_11.922399_2_plen_159_part_00
MPFGFEAREAKNGVTPVAERTWIATLFAYRSSSSLDRRFSPPRCRPAAPPSGRITRRMVEFQWFLMLLSLRPYASSHSACHNSARWCVSPGRSTVGNASHRPPMPRATRDGRWPSSGLAPGCTWRSPTMHFRVSVGVHVDAVRPCNDPHTHHNASPGT